MIFINLFLLYCSASHSPYTFRDIRKYISTDNTEKYRENELEKSLKNINIEQQKLIKKEADIQFKRIELAKQKENIIINKEKSNSNL